MMPHPHPNHILIALSILALFPTLLSSRSFDYGDALHKSLLYFEAQRSGHLPHNQRVKWRYHSGLTDGLDQGVDLVGGYYDAGDNVKFGLPMAYTITLLSWSVVGFRDEIASAGELDHALEAIKWGTDYFIKAHTHPNVLWAQVGDGDTDHLCWQRPEDMTTSRQAYKVDDLNPGSEVAAETAAAMAAAAIVFERVNPHYARLLLDHAQQLFEFGDKFRGNYDTSIEAARRYYKSISGYKDELLWAALWLHKATGNTSYLDYAIQNGESFGGTTWAITEFSWDLKYAGAQILAAMLETTEGRRKKREKRVLEEYRAKAEHYVCANLGKHKSTKVNVKRTPGGLLYTRRWNNMQYVSSSALLLSVYSDHLRSNGRMLECGTGPVGPEEILGFVKSQVDYILGSNPVGVSYLVGYGSTYPERVHHRGGSMVSYMDFEEFVGCMQGYHGWFVRRAPNPNVVVGALVGGPNLEDGFRDGRDNFAQTEACTYNTAPLLFEFGDKFRGNYDTSIEAARRYYKSISGYKDELLWAALWLHKATGNTSYLDYAIRNGESFGGTTWAITEFSWDLKYAGAQILAAVGPEEILGFVKSQVDYILGSNPVGVSYLVGYGSTYPERVHHRGGSMVSYKEFEEFVGCMQGYHGWFVRRAPNPNVVVGALVGGPNLEDGFRDGRDNFAQTEACTYNTAPLVGVFAKFNALAAKGLSPLVH